MTIKSNIPTNRQKKDEDLESLKDSITELGLFHTLSVARMRNSEKLTIMAGQRRFNALKELGWTQIPVNALIEDATETDIRIIAVNENLQRNELEDVEKGFGILAIYESKGYTGDQAIYGTKLLDNYFSRHSNAKHSEPRNLVLRLQENTKHREKRFKDDFIPDEKFVETCRTYIFDSKVSISIIANCCTTEIRGFLSKHKNLV